MALAPIELEVHEGLALLELPAGMMPPEMLAELRGGISVLSDAKGLCATLLPVQWRWQQRQRTWAVRRGGVVCAAPGYNTCYWEADDGHGLGFGDVTVPLAAPSLTVDISAWSRHTFKIER